jgi:DNA-binding response OmpR family regulator
MAAAPARASTAPRARPDEPTAEASSRILLAEDEDRMRTQVARALRRHGYQVSEADNGVTALELAAEEVPDLAIIDLRMPKMDGFEVVRQLKATHATALPVLVLSGMDHPEDRVRAFEVGADDFVAKPVHLPELLRRVEAFERTRRAYMQIKKTNDQADRLRMFSSEATALLAHDLTSGLTTTMANVERAKELARPSGEALEALEAAARTLRRMAGLVRNFVGISRQEDVSLQPDRTEVNIHELLRDVVSIHDHETRENGAGVHIKCDEKLIARIDPVILERVIHNLVGNALRYVNPGGRIRLGAHTEDRAGRPLLVIEVGNTGPGIPLAKRARMFEQSPDDQRRVKRGMGLYFCRLACEAHGGTITLDDSGEYQVNFVLRLPA